MKKIVLFLLTVALAMSVFSCFGAITVTIGSGTTTVNNFPIAASSAYSYTQQIYTQAQINQKGTIEKIRFYKASTNTMANSGIWRIFMGHTTKTSFSSTTDWINVFGMTQVYNGTVSISSTAGWKEIILQTPFFYDNVNNLVLAVDENQSGSSSSRITWRVFTAGSNSGIRNNGATNPNPLAPPTASGRNAARNQLQLDFTYLNEPSMTCIVHQGTVSHTDSLKITNIGTSSMQITNITDTAAWLTYSISLPVTIAPGATWTTPIILDATSLTGSTSVPEYTTYNATMTITTTVGTITKPVSIKVTSSDPPTNPRHIAQWEHARGALIRYPLGIPDNMILDLFNAADSLYCVVSSGNYSTAYAYFRDTVGIGAANMGRVHWIIAPSDTYWSRDWGPISMYEDDGAGGRRLCMIDFDFNRDSRTNDELLVPAIANSVHVPYYYIPMSLIGGNILTDGDKIEYADNFVMDQNDGDAATGQDGQNTFTEKYQYTPKQFEELVAMYRGDLLEGGFHGLLDPRGTYIHHIDTFAKLLSIDRVIISDGMGGTVETALDNIATWWATQKASNGNYYSVYRVQCPSSQPYTNSFIMNGHVFIPYWGTNGGGSGSVSTADQNAIAAYNTALSGLSFEGKAAYVVTGYMSRSGAAWVADDAVHCRINSIYFTDEEPPLPVELSSFTVTPSVHNQALLTWVTQTETNVAGFAIYRGTSETLADAAQLNVFIEATNTSQQQTYVYLDEEVWESGTYYYWLESRDLDGSNNFYGPISITLEPGGQYTPPVELVTGIDAVYPNPFNPAATVAYTIKTQCEVEILVYNARGQLVRNIMHETKQPGNFRIQWNGLDNNGIQCSSGLYNIVLRAGKERFNRKAVLLK
jgi:agmatine/peptidylarginine deiminase